MTERQDLFERLLDRGDKRRGPKRGGGVGPVHARPFTAIEDIWLDAVQAFMRVNGVRFPAHTDYLWIACRLGAFEHWDMTREAILRRANR